MIRRRKSNLPKWRYEFDCRKCDNIREVHDQHKGRDGDYCIPCIERMDSRRPSPIHADEKERVLRCECFTPIPEDEEEKKRTFQNYTSATRRKIPSVTSEIVEIRANTRREKSFPVSRPRK